MKGDGMKREGMKGDGMKREGMKGDGKSMIRHG
jgi:hypothetical protein